MPDSELGSVPAQRVLFDLMAVDLNHRWLARSARTFAWLLTAYTCVPFLFLGKHSTLFAQLTLRENLITLSWLAGIASLVVASPQLAPATESLARLRGVSAAALERVQWAAACNVPFRILAPAGLVISALSTLRSASPSALAQGLFHLVGVACYLLFAAGLLGLCALWARRLSPKRGRLLFLIVILVPLLLEPALPLTSLPTLLGQLLTLCLNLGGAL
ncbi:MAG TPA: hypothetical protein VL137_07065 [Polyangiaceae bacterium]|nr:hypothetical protein [Polyangiaceae bacterium]